MKFYFGNVFSYIVEMKEQRNSNFVWDRQSKNSVEAQTCTCRQSTMKTTVKDFSMPRGSETLSNIYHVVEPEMTETNTVPQVCSKCNIHPNQSASNKISDTPLKIPGDLDDSSSFYHVVEKEESGSEPSEHLQEPFYVESVNPETDIQDQVCRDGSHKSAAEKPSGIGF